MELINQKYNILEELSHGNFGIILKAENKIKKDNVVIKIEIKSDTSLLLYESKLYTHLNNYSYISKLRNFYSDNKYNIMIIDYHGDNLFNIKKNLINDTDKIKHIMLESLNAINELHKLSYIHRDIKPQNFCYDLNKNNLKLIDLGLSKSFINNKYHIINKKLSNIIGTPNYISKNVLELNTPSRRDDIESLLYFSAFDIL